MYYFIVVTLLIKGAVLTQYKLPYHFGDVDACKVKAEALSLRWGPADPETYAVKYQCGFARVA